MNASPRTGSFHKAGLVLASLTLAAMTPVAYSQDGLVSRQANTQIRAEDERPGATGPEWAVVDEYWLPLRLESATALDSARYYYGHNEETAAANEIRKAVSWLKLASSDALPITKEKLLSAQAELTMVAKDLDAGDLADAARLDAALARASTALAEYHFYRAKESYAKSQAVYAAQDLEAAVTHLEHAASSAHHEYGSDTTTVFDEVFRDGRRVTQERPIDDESLGKRIDGVEKALEEMADALREGNG